MYNLCGNDGDSGPPLIQRRLLVPLAAVGLFVVAGYCAAQQVDAGIARQIAAIQAIDNHAHPLLAPPLDKTDSEFDALPASSLEAQSDPVALRPDSALLGAAWKALYTFDTPPPLDTSGINRLNEARTRVKSQQGEHYPAWVLSAEPHRHHVGESRRHGTRSRTTSVSLGTLRGCVSHFR